MHSCKKTHDKSIIIIVAEAVITLKGLSSYGTSSYTVMPDSGVVQSKVSWLVGNFVLRPLWKCFNISAVGTPDQTYIR